MEIETFIIDVWLRLGEALVKYLETIFLDFFFFCRSFQFNFFSFIPRLTIIRSNYLQSFDREWDKIMNISSNEYKIRWDAFRRIRMKNNLRAERKKNTRTAAAADTEQDISRTHDRAECVQGNVLYEHTFLLKLM